ncbi:hypothetical protein L1987_65688 [Smallanthus sonchifolius]|uniref:Uncharacterized protein n=1 Tax=Smallanthus sonchifolius TaxID=185202 RepID=A0ACB9BV78_9ASTR|nr:hypothetical protein L1987_65688 [Smallanthus sonchifolius]
MDCTLLNPIVTGGDILFSSAPPFQKFALLFYLLQELDCALRCSLALKLDLEIWESSFIAGEDYLDINNLAHLFHPFSFEKQVSMHQLSHEVQKQESRDDGTGASSSGSPCFQLRNDAILFVSQTLQRGRKNLWQLRTSRVTVLLFYVAVSSTRIHLLHNIYITLMKKSWKFIIN